MNGAMSREVSLLNKWGEIRKNLEMIVSEDPTEPTVKVKVELAFVINKRLIKPVGYKTHELQPGGALLLNIKWLEQCETSRIGTDGYITHSSDESDDGKAVQGLTF